MIRCINLYQLKRINTLTERGGWFLKKRPMFVLDKIRIKERTNLHIKSFHLIEEIDASIVVFQLNVFSSLDLLVHSDRIEDFSNINTVMFILWKLKIRVGDYELESLLRRELLLCNTLVKSFQQNQISE